MSHVKDKQNTRYLKLFYALDKLKEHDEGLIREKFKGGQAVIGFFRTVIELNNETTIKREFLRMSELLQKFVLSPRESEMFTFFNLPERFTCKIQGMK